MKSTSSRRLQVETLESRRLLAACPADGGLALGLGDPIDETPAEIADQASEVSLDVAGAELPGKAKGAAHHGRQVERSLKIRATSTAVVSLVDGSFVAEAHGVASHLGKYTLKGVGVMDLVTGASVDSGTITVASGDEIHFEHDSGNVILTGLTGRFEGATGQMTVTPEVVGEPVVDPIAMTMTVTYVWSATGTITY